MKIAIGCDELAIDLKNALIEVIKEKALNTKTLAYIPPEKVDYPDIAKGCF